MDAARAIAEPERMKDLSGAQVELPPEELAQWRGRCVKVLFQNQEMADAQDIGSFQFDRIWSISGFVRSYLQDMPSEPDDQGIHTLELYGAEEAISAELAREVFEWLAGEHYVNELGDIAQRIYEKANPQALMALMSWLEIRYPRWESDYFRYKTQELPLFVDSWILEDYRKFTAILELIGVLDLSTARETAANDYLPLAIRRLSDKKGSGVNLELLVALTSLGPVEQVCKRHRIRDLVQNFMDGDRLVMVSRGGELGYKYKDAKVVMEVLRSAALLSADAVLMKKYAKYTAAHVDEATAKQRGEAVANLESVISQGKADHWDYQTLAVILQSDRIYGMDGWRRALECYERAKEISSTPEEQHIYRDLISWMRGLLSGSLEQQAAAPAANDTDASQTVAGLRAKFEAISIDVPRPEQPPLTPNRWPARPKVLHYATAVFLNIQWARTRSNH